MNREKAFYGLSMQYVEWLYLHDITIRVERQGHTSWMVLRRKNKRTATGYGDVRILYGNSEYGRSERSKEPLIDMAVIIKRHLLNHELISQEEANEIQQLADRRWVYFY